MQLSRIAFLFAASTLLAACQGSVSSGEPSGGGGGGGSNGGGGAGGSTSTTTSTSTSSVACKTPDLPDSFEVGSGEKCFERLTVDQEVPLMSGPQGGFHMWLAVGCEDCAATVHLKYGARDPATNMPLTGTYDEEAMVPLKAMDWPQASGLIVHMPGLSWDLENEPPPQKGTKLILWSEAYDEGGALLHKAQVEVLVGDIVEWSPCAENPNDPLCQTG